MAAPFLCREDSRKAAKGMRFPVRQTGILFSIKYIVMPSIIIYHSILENS